VTDQRRVARTGFLHQGPQPALHPEIGFLAVSLPARHRGLVDAQHVRQGRLFHGAQAAKTPDLGAPVDLGGGIYAHICVIDPRGTLCLSSSQHAVFEGSEAMRQNHDKASAAALKSSGWPDDVAGTASAIHHCLNYLAHDARRIGLDDTANLLEMVAQLALDEAKTLSARH
jgi:hypothetical protein